MKVNQPRDEISLTMYPPFPFFLFFSMVSGTSETLLPRPPLCVPGTPEDIDARPTPYPWRPLPAELLSLFFLRRKFRPDPGPPAVPVSLRCFSSS